ncbi:uncharacterized protein LOC124365487 isoform X1 [Homalodisca vitripennis]|uniref:uncharacterized protein LOC124365487 isoform X1 n=1 Tax=Homalodisca vitripennis TaxID=197043 RepID=UPI001EEA1E46|nr:uncharacterized protein LOC124365487 isoform X1 [Homalodisca vitripennis]
MCRGHLLAACIGLLLSWHYHGLSVATEPGFLDFDNLPETNFSCEGKVIGGYYADTETGCQMFHVCTIGQKGPVAGEITDIKFLCLNGTVFDQETRVCERLDEVDCSKSESFYDLNLELYGNQGAEFGIQPENEESQDAELCEEEDEEDCKTEKPLTPVKTFPTEQAHVQDEEVQDEEETTTQQPLTSSTTSRRPVVTSTSFPSTTAAPQVLQFPSSSPETIAALLALHNAFTQSLQQHNTNKDAKINPPKLTGFVESLNPSKSVQQAQTFEIKSPPSPPPPRLPTPFVPKPQSHFNVPHNPSKSQYQSPSKHQFPNQTPTSQYHSPSKTQFPNQPKPQFQNIPKPSPPVRPLSFPKPVQTTSESFGNSPFHHSFHISSQSSHFPDSSYQDQYSDHDSQPSIQPQTEAPKQYDFNDYEDDYYDEKPHSSTITPYLLHQIKVNQVQNANQAKVSSVSHGSFVREVSNPTSSKPFKVPSFRSVTTPGIAVITATSTTSSSSVKTSKPVQSAIQTQKETLTSAGFIDSILHPSNISHHIPDHPQSYDEYIESDVRHDPFYKDVPKIGRSKRSLGNEVFNRHSVTSLNHKTLIKLRDIVLKSVFKNNSETIIKTILQQYCSNQVNPSDSIVSFCSFINLSDYYKNTLFGNDWKIVIPKENNDYIYLVKTISNSNEIQNTTSNILLLVHLPDEFRLLRDSILKILDIEQSELLLTNDTDSNSLLDSSVHHRFKRIRRNKSEDRLDRKLKKYHKKIIVPTKFTSFRTKRQAVLTDGRLNLRENTQRETPQVIQHKEEPNRHGSNQRRVVVNRRRLAKVTLPLDDVEARPLPQERRRPQSIAEVDQRRESVQEKRQPLVLDDGHQSALPQERRPSSTLSGVDKTRALPQERRRPLQTPVRDSPVRSMNLKSSWDGVGSDSTVEPAQRAKERPTARQRGQGVKYHFSENRQQERIPQSRLGGSEVSEGGEVETATTYPFNLKPGTQFSCDDKIKGGYYADVEAECYGYFICSQGEINGPLLKSHFWCGPTTKFNQRSRTCQTEANVACSVSHRYFHLNKDILSLPDPDDDIKDAFEPSKVRT